MGPRVFLLLRLLAAIVLLFASEVVAWDLAETTSTTEKKDADGVNDAKYSGGGYGGVGGGCRGAGGYGGGCGGYGGGGGGGGRCYYGCCGRGYYGGCSCCASAAEAAQKGVEVKPEN